jgi:hypothetical protein
MLSIGSNTPSLSLSLGQPKSPQAEPEPLEYIVYKYAPQVLQ